MNIRKKFQKIKLPVHNKHTKPQYYDPFRKRLVSVTPEEEVRQKTAYFLRDVLQVPEDLIVTEEHLSHYGLDSRYRADIVIDAICDDTHIPLAVVECKSSEVQISDQAVDQVFSYAFALEAKYAFVSDGLDMYVYAYDDELEAYSLLEDLPSYFDMLKQNHSFQVIAEDEFERTPFELLANEDPEDIYIIGEDTPPGKKRHIKNIAEALMDCSHKACPMEYEGLKILKDLGTSYRHYGNASGSDFGTGHYRMILTEDKTGEETIYGFSIQATGKTYNDEKYGNQTGKSCLIVSKSGEKKDVLVVQINLNECLTVSQKEIIITHHGRTSMKYANIAEFKERIHASAPDLIRNERIFLGALPKGELLYLDMDGFMHLLVNLIRYCNIRDEYKQYLSKKRKNP